MKKKFTLVLFCSCLLIYLDGISQGLSWNNTGTPGFSSDTATHTTIVASTTNNFVYAAFRDADNGNKLTVMQHNGTTWSVLGTAGFSQGAVTSCTMLTASTGLYVAYSDSSANKRLRIKRYSAGVWSDDGINSFGAASNIALAVNNSGTLYVAYSDAGLSNKVMVQERTGVATWQTITGSGLSVTAAQHISLAINNEDEIFIVYSDANYANKSTVKKYSNAAWVNVGFPGFSNGAARYCNIGFDRLQNVILSYCDSSLSNGIIVRKLVGTTWVNYNTPSVTAATNLKMCIDYDNNIVVAYTDSYVGNKLNVKQHDAASNTWAAIANTAGISNGVANYVDMDLDTDRKLFVGYQDVGVSGRFVVKQLDCETPVKPVITTLNNPLCGSVDASLTSSNSFNNVSTLWYEKLTNYQEITTGIGTLNNSDSKNGAFSIATNANGIMYVVKIRTDDSGVSVRRYVNNNWVNVGTNLIGKSNGSMDGNTTDIAFHPDGTLYISYIDDNNLPVVKKLVSNSWTNASPLVTNPCKYTALSINKYGIVAFATAVLNVGVNTNYQPTVYTNNGTGWKRRFIFGYNTSSLDVTIDMLGNPVIAFNNEADKSPAVFSSIPNGRIIAAKISYDSTVTFLTSGVNKYAYYIQIECSDDNTIYYGFRAEKESLVDDRTYKVYRVFNGSNTASVINGGLCQYAFSMSLNSNNKLYVAAVDDYGTGSVIHTGVASGSNFAPITATYNGNNSYSGSVMNSAAVFFDNNNTPFVLVNNSNFTTNVGGAAELYRFEKKFAGNVSTLMLNIEGTYYTESSTSCGATDTSAKVVITRASNYNIWNGNISTAWTNAANWGCNRVPIAADDVIIPQGATNMPTISAGTVQVKNLTLDSLTTLNINGATFLVSGNVSIVSNANINTNTTGIFQLNGTTQQNLGDLNKIVNLKVNNAAGLLLNKNFLVTGNLELQQGKVFTNNYTLRANNVIGESDVAYISTSLASGVDATTGGLMMQVSSGGLNLFPVGNAQGYSPAQINVTSGATDSFTILLKTTPIVTTNATKHLEKTWFITEKNVGGNIATLSLFWNITDEGTAFSRANCAVVKANNSNTITQIGTVGAATSFAPNVYFKTITGVTSFSPWSVTSDAGVLPISILNFSGKIYNNSTAKISWQIASAETAKFYIVERSLDGSNFETVKKIDATNNANYNHNDNILTLENAVFYYRLKVVDANGSITFSKIILLEKSITNLSILNIYPTPVSDGIANISFQSATNEVTVVTVKNIFGETLISKKVNASKGFNTLELQLNYLSKGLYFVTLFQNTKYSNNYKILKQ